MARWQCQAEYINLPEVRGAREGAPFHGYVAGVWSGFKWTQSTSTNLNVYEGLSMILASKEMQVLRVQV